MTTTYWAPNQASVAQVETYTYSSPNSPGNTYTATANGKSVTYTSVSGDTAASVATAHLNLLNLSAGIAAELTEITFANPSPGVVTATAKVAGTPFANVPGTAAGLVLSTGNGLANGIATAHTTANASPSDVNDPQNWLRVQAPAPGVRASPQNGDDVVVSGTSVPLLWNLDQLTAQCNTYTRWQSFTGTVGLPEVNPGGYTEWRATYLKLSGPSGSVPAGGLQMVLGFNSGSGSGPTRERYSVGSQKSTLTILATGTPTDEYGVRFLGIHTDNVINALGGATVGVATTPGEVSQLNNVQCANGATVAVGRGVVWTTATGGAASSCTGNAGALVLNAAPASLLLENAAQATFTTDGLTWPSIVAQGGSSMAWLAGGTITALTMSQGCALDKSADARLLTITNSTIDGDTCIIHDPLNAIAFTNATTVKQAVTSGPFQVTGPRTFKIT